MLGGSGSVNLSPALAVVAVVAVVAAVAGASISASQHLDIVATLDFGRNGFPEPHPARARGRCLLRRRAAQLLGSEPADFRGAAAERPHGLPGAVGWCSRRRTSPGHREHRASTPRSPGTLQGDRAEIVAVLFSNTPTTLVSFDLAFMFIISLGHWSRSSLVGTAFCS